MDGEEEEIDWVGIAQQLDEESEAEAEKDGEGEGEEIDWATAAATATATATAMQQVISPLSLLVSNLSYAGY